METGRQGQTGFLEKMEPRVPPGTTKPIKMDTETEDSCRRKPCGDQRGQYATVTVATILPLDTEGAPEDVKKFQFIVLLAVAKTTQAVPIMAEPSVRWFQC